MPPADGTGHWDTPTAYCNGLALPVTDQLRYTVQALMPPPTTDGWWALESADCGPNTGPVDRDRAATDVRLTAADPTPTCRFTNRFHHTTRLGLVKLTTDDTTLRPLPARLELRCSGDRTPDVLRVDPGRPRGDLPRRTFTTPTTCTLDEPDNGAAPGTRHRHHLRRHAAHRRRHPVRPVPRTGVHPPRRTHLDHHGHQPADPPVPLAFPLPSATCPALPYADLLRTARGQPPEHRRLPLLLPAAVLAAVVLTAGAVLLAGSRKRQG
ncbi:hypothetical protein ACFVT9_07440 [Kitasatospora cineracea]|uniref:hypothetical protein n=1 Tax=Kitasatospora cineracea TaxID=88074 RepID=UPI0036DF6066